MASGSRNNSSGSRRGGPVWLAPPMWHRAENAGQPLTDEERALLAVIATVVRFKKGETIFNGGDAASAVFSIIDGVIKLYMVQPDREEHIVGFMFPNDLIGLAENGQYVNSAKSVTVATLYKLPARLVETRLRQHPGLDFHVITKLSHDLRRTQRHAFLLAKHRAVTKIGLFIEMLETHQNPAGSDDVELYLPMTRADIAAYVGVSPEAVSRGFGDLVSCGAISFRDRRHLRIAERAKFDAVIAGTVSTATFVRRR
jgi:CRP-like cAMP-binding protein